MSAFEQIVRPFQTQDVTPPKRVLEAPQPDVPLDQTLITIGKEPSGKTFLSKMFLFEDFTVTSNTHVEVSRTEITKTVRNPDDPSQHVDVATMSRLTTRNKTDPTVHTNYEFANK